MKGFINYVKGAYDELINHVVWPKWDEVYRMTIVVAIFSAIFAGFTAVVDFGFRWILKKYYLFIKN